MDGDAGADDDDDEGDGGDGDGEEVVVEDVDDDLVAEVEVSQPRHVPCGVARRQLHANRDVFEVQHAVQPQHVDENAKDHRSHVPAGSRSR